MHDSQPLKLQSNNRWRFVDGEWKKSNLLLLLRQSIDLNRICLLFLFHNCGVGIVYICGNDKKNWSQSTLEFVLNAITLSVRCWIVDKTRYMLTDFYFRSHISDFYYFTRTLPSIIMYGRCDIVTVKYVCNAKGGWQSQINNVLFVCRYVTKQLKSLSPLFN